jgi:drug/metabolite transporter (DMT)-like permease
MNGVVPRRRLVLVMGVGVVALSFAAVLIRMTEAPSLVIAAGRMVVASLVLAPFFWTRLRKMRAELQGKSRGLVVLAGLFLAVHFALWIESLNRTTPTSSVVLVATDPIFVAVLSPLILRERVSRRVGIAVLLGVVGSVIVGVPSFAGGMSLSGNLLALGGAACAGGYLIVGRKVRQQAGLLAYVYVMYTVAAVLLVAGVLVLRLPLAGYRPSAYGLIVLLALGPQLVGHTSFNWGLRHLTAPAVAMVILLEPVGAALLSWWILGEPPTGLEAAGGLVLAGGIYLALTDRGRGEKAGQGGVAGGAGRG